MIIHTNVYRQHADNPEVQTRVCQSLAKLSVSSDNQKVRIVFLYYMYLYPYILMILCNIACVCVYEKVKIVFQYYMFTHIMITCN